MLILALKKSEFYFAVCQRDWFYHWEEDWIILTLTRSLEQPGKPLLASSLPPSPPPDAAEPRARAWPQTRDVCFLQHVLETAAVSGRPPSCKG